MFVVEKKATTMSINLRLYYPETREDTVEDLPPNKRTIVLSLC